MPNKLWYFLKIKVKIFFLTPTLENLFILSNYMVNFNFHKLISPKILVSSRIKKIGMLQFFHSK